MRDNDTPKQDNAKFTWTNSSQTTVIAMGTIQNPEHQNSNNSSNPSMLTDFDAQQNEIVGTKEDDECLMALMMVHSRLCCNTLECKKVLVPKEINRSFDSYRFFYTVCLSCAG
ncbi:expressed unknown protein [Seminavis robusta]|uniref:Uncharacterized protein n=1 Tax=Seminavis robusta TaxID=568900 RepID=A0A9N8HCZ3_9STRA|nr:expressed unknown protein [Seminavis robusta]|eukprot:Sro435_g142350.1 n/a (113) ;mRNA; f:36377-36869